MAAEPAARDEPEAPQGRAAGRLKALAPFLVALAFGLALFALHRILRAHTYAEVAAELSAIGPLELGLALLCTLASHLALSLVERASLSVAGAPQPWPRAALGAFLHYALSNATGMAGAAGNAVRLRLYTAWGLSGQQVATVITCGALAFWGGFSALAAACFLVAPPPAEALRVDPWLLRALGALAAALLAGYALWARRGPRALEVRGLALTLPGARTFGVQVLAASLDWLACCAAFHALLPAAEGLRFGRVLGVFLLAQVAGAISHVPAGAGVFEAVVLLQLTPEPLAPPRALGALLAFRLVYYALPLAAATAVLLVQEWLRRERLRRAAKLAVRALAGLVPDVLAAATFAGGALLLASAATPAASERLTWLGRWVPLPLIEASHLLSSATGAALLVVARGLRRRVDAAWGLCQLLLCAGAGLSLLKGGDWEEACALAVLAALLASARPAFHRPSGLWDEAPRAGWIAAVAAALAGSVALGLFAFKHVPYTHALWTRVSLEHGDAPRFLRASAAALCVALVLLLHRALRPARPEAPTPTAGELERARAVVERSPATGARLALLGDKSFLWSASGRAFVAYAAKGRSLVAMGEPVGPEEEHADLLWRFRELADRHDRLCVFYQVSAERLHAYVDLGLAVHKLGEAALVDLRTFDLSGGARKSLRHAVRRAEAEGLEFAVLEPAQAAERMAELRAVSDEWLAAKGAREKGFSLGWFDERSLCGQPIAVVLRAGRVEAFANLWLGADRAELSCDLMRHRGAAPAGTMDFLFARTFAWGRAQGFARFDLGMAPLTGLEQRPLMPFWNRLGALVVRGGERAYNFQGLRAYKQKFAPGWHPRYLASPGGLALPRVLADVAVLIASPPRVRRPEPDPG
jgi:phosphatidylglycerol lysyltransferase